MARFFLFWYFISINVFSLFMMRNDKRRAKKRERRVSERNLWLLAILGGAPAMTVGMHMYRHKTKHFNFKYGLPALAVIDAVIYSYLLVQLS